MKYLFICLLLMVSSIQAEITSDSTSGALAGAASQSGAIGQIDGSTNTSTVEADNLHDLAPGVFSAGITAGGANKCIVSVGGGFSVGGGGLNYAEAYTDKECTVQEALRLLVAIAAQPTDASKAVNNHILLRETACQSAVYWKSMERTYLLTNDESFHCSNEYPGDDTIRVSLRPIPRTNQDVAQGLPVKNLIADNRPIGGRGDHNGFW